jgi:hypothetical protein
VVIELVENNPYFVVANQSSWADLLVMGTHSRGRLASSISIGPARKTSAHRSIMRRPHISAVTTGEDLESFDNRSLRTVAGL